MRRKITAQELDEIADRIALDVRTVTRLGHSDYQWALEYLSQRIATRGTPAEEVERVLSLLAGRRAMHGASDA